MTTKELCIGNWVTDNNGIPLFVQAIFDDNTVYLDFDGNEGDTWEVDIEDVKPIKITDDFLYKNEFDNRYTPDIFSRMFEGWCVSLIPFGKYYNLKLFHPGYNFSDVTVRFVHEMQNVILLVTHKEMEVQI